MASFSRPGIISQGQASNSIQTAPLVRMSLIPKILNFWTGGDHHSIGSTQLAITQTDRSCGREM